MNYFVLVMAAIAACAIANPVIPHYVCSVQGSGLANLTIGGEKYVDLAASMFRVRDTVRYDITKDGIALLTILSRPDIPNGYAYFAPNKTCIETGVVLALRNYKYNSDVNGWSLFKIDDVADLYVRTGAGEVKIKESLKFNMFGGVSIDFTYTSFDSYKHKAIDNKFSVVCDSCPAAGTDATLAKTSDECRQHVPSYFCSVSGNGTVVVQSTSTLHLNVSMIRVQNTVRYDMTDCNDSLVISVVRRYDVDKTFVYNNQTPSCNSFTYAPRLDQYFYETTTKDGRDIYNHFDPHAYLAFDIYSKDIVEEHFLIDNVYYTINYTSINREYVHENVDDAFSLANVDGDCAPAKSNATMTNSSALCLAESSDVSSSYASSHAPSTSTASSASTSSTTSSVAPAPVVSTSSASFSVPFIMVVFVFSIIYALI